MAKGELEGRIAEIYPCGGICKKPLHGPQALPQQVSVLARVAAGAHTSRHGPPSCRQPPDIVEIAF